MRLSPKKPWTLEIDVKVEGNGAVFLVYPLSDPGREWLDDDQNVSGGGRFQAALKHLRGFEIETEWERVGEILLVQPHYVLRLWKRMVEDGDLWVVWW